MIKQGKKFDDVIRNEKQQLMSLLKDIGRSKNKKKAIKNTQNEVQKNQGKGIEKHEKKEEPKIFVKPALKPIKIPEDPVDIQENVVSKGSQLKKRMKEKIGSVDTCTRNRQLRK